MPTASAADVVSVLDELPLLQPAQLRELRGGLHTQFSDPRALCDEMIRRGWLSEFQRDALLAGRGTELVLGPYILMERIGTGGMGEVFKARHQLLKRIVALKVTRSDCLSDDDDERRFVREIQATAQLTHPNIVSALDANQFDGMFVLAMEYVEGTNLAHLVRDQGPVPVPKACEYIRQAALGLQHAFERGLVHRDIKPSNLLLTADGTQVKIADLGLVRLGRGAEETPLTKSGTMIGTPEYLAPEQAADSRHVDIRADLYSLGCSFYYLLAGRPPFADGNTLALIYQHLEAPPPPIQGLRPDVPADVAAVLHKLLAKKPQDRYQQPAELAAALERLLNISPSGSPSKEKAATPSEEPSPRSARRRLLVALGTLAVCVGVGVGVWRARARNQDGADRPPFTNSIGVRFIWVAAEQRKATTEVKLKSVPGAPAAAAVSKPLYWAVQPITAGEFKAFVQATRYQTEAERDNHGALRWVKSKDDWEPDLKCTWQSPGWTPADDLPVVCLTRYDALAFCYWLGRKEGRAYRLPTEAEWELACLAGNPSVEEARRNAAAITTEPAERSGKATDTSSAPADTRLQPDIPKKLWCWCADSFGREPNAEKQAADSPDSESNRWGVLRGMVWSAEEDRSGPFRLGLNVKVRRNDCGFRIVLEPGVR